MVLIKSNGGNKSWRGCFGEKNQKERWWTYKQRLHKDITLLSEKQEQINFNAYISCSNRRIFIIKHTKFFLNSKLYVETQNRYQWTTKLKSFQVFCFIEVLLKFDLHQPKNKCTSNMWRLRNMFLSNYYIYKQSKPEI